MLSFILIILLSFSNCTAKVMPLEKPAKRSDIIVYKGHAFLTAVKALDRRQFLSERQFDTLANKNDMVSLYSRDKKILIPAIFKF